MYDSSACSLETQLGNERREKIRRNRIRNTTIYYISMREKNYINNCQKEEKCSQESEKRTCAYNSLGQIL